MKKIFLLILMCVFFVSVTPAQTTFDVLHQFKQKSLKHEIGINWGYGLSLLGLLSTPIGVGIASTGITLSQLNITNEYESNALLASGYSLIGIGISSLVIGLIVWRNQEKKYIDVINRQYKYRDFIHEKEKIYEKNE